jgi:hypothetical protein
MFEFKKNIILQVSHVSPLNPASQEQRPSNRSHFEVPEAVFSAHPGLQDSLQSAPKRPSVQSKNSNKTKKNKTAVIFNHANHKSHKYYAETRQPKVD